MSQEPIWKDSTGQSWTRVEIQALVNQVRSLTKAAARLGLRSVKQLRDLGVYPPAEALRLRAQQTPDWLPKFVLQCGSAAAAGELLNVSTVTILNVLNSLGISTAPPQPSATEVAQAMEKFGSVIFVARLFETKVSQIKNILFQRNRNQDGCDSVSLGFPL